MKRERRKRLSVTVTESQWRELRTRARLLNVPMAEYLRAAGLGRRPNSRGAEAAADDWWEQLPPSRRAQVHGWLTAGGSSPRLGPPLSPPLPYPDMELVDS